jgi:hypothetical protein
VLVVRDAAEHPAKLFYDSCWVEFAAYSKEIADGAAASTGLGILWA